MRRLLAVESINFDQKHFLVPSSKCGCPCLLWHNARNVQWCQNGHGDHVYRLLLLLLLLLLFRLLCCCRCHCCCLGTVVRGQAKLLDVLLHYLLDGSLMPCEEIMQNHISDILPNQQRTLNKLLTELQCRNFVNKHRLGIQVGAKCAKTYMYILCRML